MNINLQLKIKKKRHSSDIKALGDAWDKFKNY